MIIFRYLTREITLTTIVVISVLFGVFLCQILLRYLNAIAIGRYPVMFLIQLLLTEVPYLLTLLIPLSFYIASVFVLGRMRTDTELMVLAAHGMSPRRLLGYVMVIASIFAVISGLLSCGLNPKVLAQRQAIRMQAQSAALVDMLTPGRFHMVRKNRQVLYVKSLTSDKMRAVDLFMAQHPGEAAPNWQVIVAREGWIASNQETKRNYIILQDGYRYSGMPGEPSFQVMQFTRYAMQAPESTLTVKSDPSSLETRQLWQQPLNRAYQAEWHWRVAFPLSVWILAIAAVLMEGTNPRSSRYVKMIPAAFLYIVYAHGLFLAKEWLNQGTLPIAWGLWWVHLSVLSVVGLPWLWRQLRRARLWVRR